MGYYDSLSFSALLLMMMQHTLVAHNDNGPRLNHLWWYQLKNNNSLLNRIDPYMTSDLSALSYNIHLPSNTVLKSLNKKFNSVDKNPFSNNNNNYNYNKYYGPSDDELMTQASKLNSHMTRTISPSVKFLKQYDEPLTPISTLNNDNHDMIVTTSATNFDDVLNGDLFHGQHLMETGKDMNVEKMAATNSKPFFRPFDEMVNNFQQRRNVPINSDSDRIWSFFDTHMNHNNYLNQKLSNWKTFDNRDNGGSSINSIVDGYINKLTKRNQSGSKSLALIQNMKLNNKKTTPQDNNNNNNNNNILRLNLNRRKNPEEKEKFRQLIQNIFDSTPRKSYGYGSEDSGYNKMEQENDNSGDELQEEREENVLFNENNEDNKDIVNKIIGNERDEDDDDDDNNNNGDDNGDDDSVDNSNDSTLSDRRNLIQAKEDITSDEDDSFESELSIKNNNENFVDDSDENEDEPEDEDDSKNQYLKPLTKNNNTQLESYTYGTRITSMNNNNNLTIATKKKALFRVHLNGRRNQKNPNILISATTTENINDDLTTITPFVTVTPVNDIKESLTLTNKFVELSFNNNNNGTEISTEIEPDLKNKLITKRKQQRVGKWMDVETFELRNDDENEDDDDDDKTVHKLHGQSKKNSRIQDLKSVHRTSNTLSPKKQQSIRFARQNILYNNHSDDEMVQLSQILPGTPGQDYPVFGSIPRTKFNCHDHQWPGYYADVETQCQVFHICQTGGRKTSFLCPNGTMFNQQMFICDWWHNVQCDDVTTHYGLNAHIYEPNWESNRLSKSANPNDQSLRVSIRRMAVLEPENDNNDNNSKNNVNSSEQLKKVKSIDSDLSPSTTIVPTLINQTTTTETTAISLTESVFGVRKSSFNKDGKKVLSLLQKEKEDKLKRKFLNKNIKVSTKEDLPKFSKLNQNNKTKSSDSIKTKVHNNNNNNNKKFTRHRFTHQGQINKKITPLPQMFPKNLKLSILPMTSTLVSTSTRPGKYHRT